MTNVDQLPDGVDPTTPAAARMYDYILGGTANYPVDQEAAERAMAAMPDTRDAMWANRGFLQRASRWIAAQGVDQFVDIGAGLPTQCNTHDAVRSVAPHARVVYADNDPLVIDHGRHLVRDLDGVDFIAGDLLDGAGLLARPEVTALVDTDRPIGLLVVAVTHLIPDEAGPHAAVASLVAALPVGSYLALSNGTADRNSGADDLVEVYKATPNGAHFRTHAEVTRFFDGLEMVPPYEGGEPAISYVGLWGAEDADQADSDGSRWIYAGVGRKPALPPLTPAWE